MKILATATAALAIACAALAGYTVGNADDGGDAYLAAPDPGLISFYVARDLDKDKAPSQGDMASFFISPEAGMDGPWVIRLDCWDSESKTAAFLSVADPASLNQPFYRLASPTWPKGAAAYCEYVGTQAGVEFGSGSFLTY